MIDSYSFQKLLSELDISLSYKMVQERGMSSLYVCGKDITFLKDNEKVCELFRTFMFLCKLKENIEEFIIHEEMGPIRFMVCYY